MAFLGSVFDAELQRAFSPEDGAVFDAELQRIFTPEDKVLSLKDFFQTTLEKDMIMASEFLRSVLEYMDGIMCTDGSTSTTAHKEVSGISETNVSIPSHWKLLLF